MIAEFFNTVLTAAVTVFLYMNFAFLISLKKKRADIADIAWGGAFIVIALASLFASPVATGRACVITTLVILWGFRLATYIFLRNRRKTEDFRYRRWREQWKSLFLLRAYLQIFMLQGFLALLISAPIILINSFDQPGATFWDFFGCSMWAVGFFFEAVGDWQLAHFLADEKNKGRIMRYGLWKYTRHPNYFGEVTQWWGIFFIALSVPYGLLSIVGPLTITFLILKISGIPMLEKSMENNIEFQEYKKNTNAFFPWKPRNPKSI